MQKYFIPLFFCFLLGGLSSGYSQKPDWEELCLAHGGVPWDSKKNGSRACPDGGPCGFCPVCKEIREETNRKAKAEQARQKEYYSEQNVRQREAREEAEKQKQKDLEALMYAERVVEYNAIQTRKDEARAAIYQKFNDRNEAVKQQLNERLERIQQANAVKAILAGEDNFWNETVELASYVPVRNPSGGSTYGYKNKSGDLKIDYRYREARPFYKGVAAVMTSDYGDWQLINSQGKVVADLKSKKIYSVEDFSDGIAVVALNGSRNDNKYGAIDTKGNLVTGTEFYSIQPFKNGVAMAVKYISEETIVSHSCKTGNCGGVSGFDVIYYEKGIIDKGGNWVETPVKQYDTEYHNKFTTDESPHAMDHINFSISMENWFSCLTGYKTPMNSQEQRTWDQQAQCRITGNEKYEKQYDEKIASLQAQGYTHLGY